MAWTKEDYSKHFLDFSKKLMSDIEVYETHFKPTLKEYVDAGKWSAALKFLRMHHRGFSGLIRREIKTIFRMAKKISKREMPADPKAILSGKMVVLLHADMLRREKTYAKYIRKSKIAKQNPRTYYAFEIALISRLKDIASAFVALSNMLKNNSF